MVDDVMIVTVVDKKKRETQIAGVQQKNQKKLICYVLVEDRTRDLCRVKAT